MDWHSDGIQAWADATNVTIVHNTILLSGSETGAVNMVSNDSAVQHNGSVPTVELVLNTTARPKYWRRVDYDSKNFNEQALGFSFVEVTEDPRSLPDDERKHVYDATRFSQSNTGHPFGDHLTDEQRKAVIEYLKTL